MASSSAWRWTWHNSFNSSFKSCSISVYPFIFTHSHRQPSSFIFPHNHHHHHHHHHHHPSPSFCCSSAQPNNAKRRFKKSHQKLQIGQVSFSQRRHLCDSSDIPVLKEVEAIMDPAAFTAVRFVVSAIPFLPFAWRAWSDVPTRNSGIELGFWVSLGYLMQALGLMTSDAGRASFISMFTVIVVPLIDGMLGAVIPARTWFGALMSIIGVGMLECSGSPPCVGDLFNFLSALFFGIHMLRTEHISRKTDKENFLPVLGYEVCVVALSSIIWFLIGSTMDGSLEYHPSSWTWAVFLKWMVEFPWIPALYTGVFSTGLCLWIEMTAMRDISATETAIVYGLEPVWGAGFAWFLLGERWGVSGWFGAALVLGGSLMVQIMGATSPSSTVKVKKEEDMMVVTVTDRQNGLSASPVPVSSRKDVSNLLKKKY